MGRGLNACFLALSVACATSVSSPGQTGCGDCGGLPPAIQAQVNRMQSAPISFTRDAAAHDLRVYDWRQYPQILDALTSTLLADPIAHVRSEAAQTLLTIKPAPCVPEVRSALARAVASERNPIARSWMRKALQRVELACGPASSGGCSPCDTGPSVISSGVVTRSEPDLIDPFPLNTGSRESDVRRAGANTSETQVQRNRMSEIPQEAPLDLQPQTPPTRGPAPEAEPELSPSARDLAPPTDPDLSRAVRKVPAPPHLKGSSGDLFGGTLPPLQDTEDPLPAKLPRLSEPTLLPPAPPAEEISPFERAAQSEGTRSGQKRDRFASNTATNRRAPGQTTSYQTKADHNLPIIGDVAPEPAPLKRKVGPLRIFQRSGR